LEIDAVLIMHPDVTDAGTIGVPHPIYGEEVVAYVTCFPGKAVSYAEIVAHCEGQLPEAKQPKAVYVLEELPKNPRGKLDRSAILTYYIENHAKIADW